MPSPPNPYIVIHWIAVNPIVDFHDLKPCSVIYFQIFTHKPLIILFSWSLVFHVAATVIMADAALKKFKEELEALDEDDRRKSLAAAHALLGPHEAEKRQPVKPRKLRSFSGATTVPSGELDYKMWRLHAKPIVDDPFLRESEKKRALIDALLGDALEIASTLLATDTSETLLTLLDKHFGDVADGFELYSKFRSAIQESQESAADFLKRLHTLALRAVEKQGMKSDDVKSQVLRQFDSNCADEDLLQRLSLKDKFENPDDVSDLLLKVRTEEARRKEKRLKLKARTAKANAISAAEASASSSYNAEMESLHKKIESLTQQVQASKPSFNSYSQSPPTSTESSSNNNHNRKGSHSKKKSGIFCYKCGVDGHKHDACSSPANPTLVQERLLARQNKQGNGKK